MADLNLSTGNITPYAFIGMRHGLNEDQVRCVLDDWNNLNTIAGQLSQPRTAMTGEDQAPETPPAGGGGTTKEKLAAAGRAKGAAAARSHKKKTR
jgi:hypothetical protein